MRTALVVAVILTAGGPAFGEEPAPPLPPSEQVPERPAPEPAPPIDPAYGEPPAAPDPADGGARYFAAPKGKDIVVHMHADRSRRNVAGLAITAGAGLALGGLGLYFHLDSKAATEDVGADRFTGEFWSAGHQDAYDRAHRSAVAAGVLYGVGGGLLIGAAIAYIVTEPKRETTIIHPHVAFGARGAAVAGGWRF